ncbi:MAG: hypothetical protein ACRD4Q_14975 [Candidatus Acidiferrales bacterium]
MTHPAIQRVTARELRQLFNEGKYWDRAKAGELTCVTIEQRHPALPLANEPFCTFSQMISYRDREGNEVARVHQYLRPDGRIGASGKPDPKRLLQADVLYRLTKNT